MADNYGFQMKDEGEMTTANGEIRQRNNVETRGARTHDTVDVMYGVDDNPPWYLCIILGFQHYLMMFGPTLAVPLILMPQMCVGDNHVATSEVISTIFFVSGICTLLQTLIGSRLPIVQGGSFSYVAPAVSILALEEFKCPDDSQGGSLGSGLNETMNATTTDSDIWQIRMREIQGAIIAASAFQVVIGATGLVGLIMNAIGPLTVAPTVALIGFSLFKSASRYAADQWYIALMTIFLVALFSQYLKNIRIPCGQWGGQRGGRSARRGGFPVFELFPVILAIIVAWAICGILTATDVFSPDKTKWGYEARTDVRIRVLSDAAWFRFPYPFQWGLPTFSVGSVFGMLAGVLAGLIESIGDYFACARLSGAPPPPVHAINRGIFIEGLGCMLAGMWGSGNGTTSHSENIGAIGITKVGSRRVVQYGAVIMLLLAMLGKFGALFVTIPDPIVGGVFMVMFGMIVAIGISNLQYVDLNSSRNLFIFGFSIFFGLSLPQWMSANQNVINTGNEPLNKILTVLFSTSMFVGGASGFILDNTVPGTPEERGLTGWREDGGDPESGDSHLKCYDLPFGMNIIRKANCTRFIPFCPTFTSCFKGKCCNCCGGNRGESNEPEVEIVVNKGSENGSYNKTTHM